VTLSAVVDCLACRWRPGHPPPPARPEYAGRASEIELRIGGSGSRAVVILSELEPPGPGLQAGDKPGRRARVSLVISERQARSLRSALGHLLAEIDHHDQ
jgi:hypothetical protein